MTDETIKVTEESKQRLEEIKENYYEHTSLTYSEAVDVLVAEYDSSADTSEGSDESSDVNRTSAGGDSESSEDDEFPGGANKNQGLSAEEKAAKFRQ